MLAVVPVASRVQCAVTSSRGHLVVHGQNPPREHVATPILRASGRTAAMVILDTHALELDAQQSIQVEMLAFVRTLRLLGHALTPEVAHAARGVDPNGMIEWSDKRY